MVDYISGEIKGITPGVLEQNPLLEFQCRLNKKTGEIDDFFSNAYYKGLEFQILRPTPKRTKTKILLKGSLHKYWNNGAHNFNDFDLNSLNEVLQDLKNNFGIKPENTVLRALEIGVNITPPTKTKGLLNQCVMHKRERFKWVATKDEGNYIQAQYQRHILKVYDKRTHYKNKGFKIDKEILRIEVKYLKMHELKKDAGIETLEDLLNYGLQNFKSKLLNSWDEVIFCDTQSLKKSKYLHQYSSPVFWETASNDKIKYHKKNLDAITRNNPDNIKQQIANLICAKVDLITNSTPKINPLYIGLKTGVDPLKNTCIHQQSCKVTGLNISMQKESSNLLSHTGLKYYYKTDRKVFKEVCRKYLTVNWADADYKTKIKEIAHNIRNAQSNQNRKQNRLYPPGAILLFDITKF